MFLSGHRVLEQKWKQIAEHDLLLERAILLALPCKQFDINTDQNSAAARFDPPTGSEQSKADPHGALTTPLDRISNGAESANQV